MGLYEGSGTIEGCPEKNIKGLAAIIGNLGEIYGAFEAIAWHLMGTLSDTRNSITTFCLNLTFKQVSVSIVITHKRTS